MSQPLFRTAMFIETACERRCQAMRRSAWHKRSWHVSVADPGAGKTMGMRDLVRTAGAKAVLAVTAPKNNAEALARGNQVFSALGLPLRGRWSDRKPTLRGDLHQYGPQCLMIDEAPDLSLEHLMFLKELTDQGRLPYDHPLGLCVVAAGRGHTIPLTETLDLPDPTWLPCRRRLDKLEPFCQSASHTSEAGRAILAPLETGYQPLVPHLTVRQWGGSIYPWLPQPILDPTHSGRVTRDALIKLVTTALEWTYQAGDTAGKAVTLEQAAELRMLRRETLWIIAGAGPSIVALPAASTGPDQASETVAAPVSSPHAPPPSPPAGPTAQVEQARSRTATTSPSILSTTCTFSGVVPMALTRFLERAVSLVACPDGAATRTLNPHGGVLRCKVHAKRQTTTPNTGQRWARGETAWEVVGGSGEQEQGLGNAQARQGRARLVAQKNPRYEGSIDRIREQATRCEAVCPGTFVLVLMFQGKYSTFRANPAHLVGHLPGVLRTYDRAAEAVRMIHRALEHGVTYCDTAPAYAGSLDYYGAALGERRAEIFLASKTHDRTRDGSLRLLEQSLRRVRTTHLDLWQLHDLRTRRDLERIFSPGGALEALVQARAEGLVRFLGVTGHHDPAMLQEAMRRFPFDTALLALNAADIHRLAFIPTALADATQRGMGVIGMKVYAQGALLGPDKLSAEEAMGYVRSLPGVSTVVVGCRTPAEVDDNVRIARQFAAFAPPHLRRLETRTQRYAAACTAYKKSA